MSEASAQAEIEALSAQIYDLTTKLHELQKAHRGSPVRNYEFATQHGRTTLLDLFADQNTLMLIHNMGQGCRWCTVWADGFNGFLPHLESAMSVVLVSKDAPEASADSPTAAAGAFASPHTAAATTSRSNPPRRALATCPAWWSTSGRAMRSRGETAPCSGQETSTARSGTCWHWRGWERVSSRRSSATGADRSSWTTAARTCSTE